MNADWDAVLAAAEADLACRQLAPAKGRFEQVHRQAPRSSPAWLRSALELARLALLGDDADTARRLLDEALKHWPRSAEALSLRGLVDEASDDEDAAATFQRKALEVDPTLALAHFHLGRLEAQRSRWTEAVRHLERACELEPNNPSHRYVLGTVLFNSGAVDQALATLARCLAESPAYFPSWASLADVLVAAGRTDVADEVLRRGEALFPQAGLLSSKRAALAIHREDLPSAKEHLRRQAEVEPKRAEAWLNLCLLSTAELEFEEAEALAKEALAREPNSAAGHYQLGLIYDACKLRDAAERAYRDAIRCDPGCWRAYNNLGVLLLESEEPTRWQEAMELIALGGTRCPDKEAADLRYNLALAFWKLGQKEESERWAHAAAASGTEHASVEEAKRFLGNFVQN